MSPLIATVGRSPVGLWLIHVLSPGFQVWGIVPQIGLLPKRWRAFSDQGSAISSLEVGFWQSLVRQTSVHFPLTLHRGLDPAGVLGARRGARPCAHVGLRFGVLNRIVSWWQARGRTALCALAGVQVMRVLAVYSSQLFSRAPSDNILRHSLSLLAIQCDQY